MLKNKLLIIVIIIFILAIGLFYWLKFKNSIDVNKPSESISELKTDNSQISEEILKKISPPSGYDESKVSANLDPKILKRIGPPPYYKSSVSAEISPEILKLIGPPTSN